MDPPISFRFFLLLSHCSLSPILSSSSVFLTVDSGHGSSAVMGVLDIVRPGRDGRDKAAPTETDADEKQGATATAGVNDSDQQDAAYSDPETRSLEAREDKEVTAHPDSITEGTYAGLQKAEAVALVWSRKAVLATYAWWVFCSDKLVGNLIAVDWT